MTEKQGNERGRKKWEEEWEREKERATDKEREFNSTHTALFVGGRKTVYMPRRDPNVKSVVIHKEYGSVGPMGYTGRTGPRGFCICSECISLSRSITTRRGYDSDEDTKKRKEEKDAKKEIDMYEKESSSLEGESSGSSSSSSPSLSGVTFPSQIYKYSSKPNVIEINGEIHIGMAGPRGPRGPDGPQGAPGLCMCNVCRRKTSLSYEDWRNELVEWGPERDKPNIQEYPSLQVYSNRIVQRLKKQGYEVEISKGDGLVIPGDAGPMGKTGARGKSCMCPLVERVRD